MRLRVSSFVASLALLLAGTSCSGVARVETRGDHTLVQDVDGRPMNFAGGDTLCYGVWHTTDEGWHVAVTSAGLRLHFSGKIAISGNGHFANVKDWKSAGEKAAEVEHRNWGSNTIRLVPENEPKAIIFDLLTEGGHVSGLKFDVVGEGPIYWDLGLGGSVRGDPPDRDPAKIKIGRLGRRPPSVPFETDAHPNQPAHGE